LKGKKMSFYPIIAYEIMPSLDHLDALPEDPMDREYGYAENYDALIYKPTQQRDLSWGGMTGTIPFLGSEPVNFVGFLDRLPHQTDFLSADYFEPIISKRMLYILHSLGNFSHKAISVRIYDYSFQYQGENNYEGNATPLAGKFNEDYVGLQLLEHIDGIDAENSEFRPSLNPDILPPQIINLVLKEPAKGFPPIFRLNRSAESIHLFVSPAAKEVLEDSGIKGIRFFPKKGSRAQETSTVR
jgi:hypothetical protein